MHAIELEAFEALVGDAVEALPAEFRAQIENLSFGIEELATAADLRSMGIGRGRTLLGVYRGVPLPRRGSGYQLTMPDRIVIFRQPHQQMAQDGAHLAELVAHTVRHEVAHYFGISDARLRELDAY